jgi:arginine decarboxylase
VTSSTPVDLRLRLDLITTTSPSALTYGSVDGWRRHMVTNGKALLGDALGRADRLRERLGGVDGFEIIDGSIVGHDGVAEWDPLKLSVDVSVLGITGYQAKEWMQSEHEAVVQYLRAGQAAGMTLPDAADPDLKTFRVVRR